LKTSLRKERKTEVQNGGESGLNKKRKHHSRNTLDENREYSLEELEHGLKKAVDGLARIEKRRRMMQQLEQIEEELNLMYKKLERAD
jgi:flagellar motor component MotA